MSANERVQLMNEIMLDLNGQLGMLTSEITTIQGKVFSMQERCVEVERLTERLSHRMKAIVDLLVQRRQGELRRVDSELEEQAKKERNHVDIS